jgi:3-phosphoshikimate 1-carboxyvinyltransferase
MRIRAVPGGRLQGSIRVAGDKSIAHRWLILASTASSRSRLTGLPSGLDVGSTASSLADLTVKSRPALDLWARNVSSRVEGGGSTWNDTLARVSYGTLEVEGEGRDGLVEPRGRLDCGNSGTSMRLLAGLLAAAPFTTELTGDPSLSSRPMERVASPLRSMGATVRTTDGHAPISVTGGRLVGIEHRTEVPSAQVKSAVLLAGVWASGETVVLESAPTRDHTERAFEALGAPVRRDGRRVGISRFQHEGFGAAVPGDPSSAALVVAAAALTGSEVTVEGVGLNPTRLHFLEVLSRMGVATETSLAGEELGEPVGSIHVLSRDALRATTVDADELPLVIDEVPVLAMLGTHAPAETRFLGASELRVKESDRLTALVEGIRTLGGQAAAEADDLVIAGGGLRGGVASSGGDHRLAMAFAVGALAGDRPSEVAGMEAAAVSFPDFVGTLRSLGAAIEVIG